MNIYANKSSENRNQSVANEHTQKQETNKSTFQFMDNRSEMHTNRKLQEVANVSPQAKQTAQLQAMATNSHTQQQLLLQAGASPEFGQGVIQNAINVTAAGAGTPDVSIKATGDAKDFKNGDSAGNRGWNHVISYSGRAYIDQSFFKRTKGGKTWHTRRETVRAGPYNNNYLAAEAGHVLAKQNGGYGSNPENVFAQDGGVNNGPWKTNFENPMRRALNNCYDDDQVDLRVGLHGDENITIGDLEKISDDLDADHESIFDTTDESGSDSDSSSSSS